MSLFLYATLTNHGRACESNHSAAYRFKYTLPSCSQLKSFFRTIAAILLITKSVEPAYHIAHPNYRQARKHLATGSTARCAT
jgi:hypothetical protein